MQLSLLQRIAKRDRLTQSEQKIASFFKDNMNQLAFETVSSISRKTGVSKATTVRFIASLGYNGFSDFQKQLRDHMVQRLQPPITRLPLMKQNLQPGGENVLESSFNHIIANLNETLANIDLETFLTIARLIANCEGRVFIDGHRISGGLAQILWVKMQYFRSGVVLIDSSALTVPELLSDIKKEDVLFSITQSRYCDATRLIASYFSEMGATVIMLTDSEWMPYADKADYKLVVSTEWQSMYNNTCSALALIEALIVTMAQLCEKTAYEQSRRNEKLLQRFDTFAIDLKNPTKPIH